MKLVPYYRVSTRRQGESGLGMEAQQAAVQACPRQRGATIVASYTEVESGKWADLPELAKAIGHANLARATLAAAKLDRLARNVAFLSALMESGVDFAACDNEHTRRLRFMSSQPWRRKRPGASANGRKPRWPRRSAGA